MKISVILTLYNSEKIVLRTIQSILAQEGIGKLFDLELIVIDDCSTDGTRSILDQAHIAYLSTPVNSGGPNRGRNIGLRAATGDYITIVDHDDEWKPWRIKAILPYLDQSSILTSGYLTKYLNNGKEYEVVAARNTELLRFPKNATFLQKLTKSNQGQNTYLGCIVYPQHLKDIFFEEHFGMVDYDWVLRLFHQQESLEVCQALYTRYVDQANLSRNENYRRKDFFYSLSDASLQSRFMSMRTSMPHEELQHFVVIDYTRDMVILAITYPEEEKEEVIGIGQYSVNTGTHTADAAFAVRDEYQGHGIGTELISYLTYLAKKRGILGFTADVLSDNWGMLRAFDKMGYDTKRIFEGGAYRLDMMFKRDGAKKLS